MKSADTIESVLRFKGRQVCSIAPTATVYEAIARMSEKSVGALLVLTDECAMSLSFRTHRSIYNIRLQLCFAPAVRREESRRGKHECSRHM
jgi:hypothetical protein